MVQSAWTAIYLCLRMFWRMRASRMHPCPAGLFEPGVATCASLCLSALWLLAVPGGTQAGADLA